MTSNIVQCHVAHKINDRISMSYSVNLVVLICLPREAHMGVVG